MSLQRISQCLVGSRIKNCYLPFPCPLNSLNNRNKPTRFSKSPGFTRQKLPIILAIMKPFTFVILLLHQWDRNFPLPTVNREKTIYEFLVNNEHNIPLNVVNGFVSKQRPPVSTDFANADIVSISYNFFPYIIVVMLKKHLIAAHPEKA